jgi:phosphate transport system permease protein
MSLPTALVWSWPTRGGSGALARRKLKSLLGWALCLVALGLAAVPVIWVVVAVAEKAIAGWHWSVLFQSGAGESGGLANEILGTLLLCGAVVVVAGTLGILAGIYLAEYAKGRIAAVLRGASEVLAGVPSIVLGYVGYMVLVVDLHWGLSLGAGTVALSALTIPYIAKGTETALTNLSSSLREGASALGMTRAQQLWRVALPAARPGIATGLLVAVAISLGETAPLLYTVGFSARPPVLALTHHPVPFLTYAVWSFWNEPYPYSIQLSYDASLILVVLVLLFIGAARLASRTQHRQIHH